MIFIIYVAVDNGLNITKKYNVFFLSKIIRLCMKNAFSRARHKTKHFGQKKHIFFVLNPQYCNILKYLTE